MIEERVQLSRERDQQLFESFGDCVLPLRAGLLELYDRYLGDEG